MLKPGKLPWIVAFIAAALGIFIRWYFVTHAQVLQPLDEPNVRADAVDYYRYAWNVAHHQVFSSAVPSPLAPAADSFRDPGYPLFLAFWMWVFPSYDAWYAAVLLAQAVLGGITAAFLVLAFRNAVPTWLLGVLAVFAATWPHAVSMTAYVLSENLTAVLVAALLLAIRHAVARPSLMNSILAGLAFAIAGMTNAVLVPLVVPVAGALLLKRSLGGRHIATLLFAAIIPLAAWTLRNAAVSSEASSSFRAEQNFVQGSWPIYHEAYQLSSRGDASGIRAIDEINEETSLLRANLRQGLTAMGTRIGDRPWMYLGWYLSKPAVLWGWDIRIGQGDIYVYPTRQSPYATDPAFKAMEAIAFIINPLLALLALGGVVLVVARRESNAVVTVAATAAVWVTFVYGVLQSEPRYAIPFRGLEIALACVATNQAIRWLRERKFHEP